MAAALPHEGHPGMPREHDAHRRASIVPQLWALSKEGIHSFTKKYLWNAYYTPDVVQGSEEDH